MNFTDAQSVIEFMKPAKPATLDELRTLKTWLWDHATVRMTQLVIHSPEFGAWIPVNQKSILAHTAAGEL